VVALKYTSAVNGFTDLAITKLDVLAGLPELKVCTRYRVDGKETDRFPADLRTLAHAEPVYETLAGFEGPLAGSGDIDALPPAARDYLAFMSDFLRVPISMVSTGPRREETLRALG
jgi:adenylosuccinate synthase